MRRKWFIMFNNIFSLKCYAYTVNIHLFNFTLCLFDWNHYAGILFVYIVIQTALWWLFHITVLFCKVVFPLYPRLCSKTNCIHTTFVIIGILIPLVPVLTTMANFAADLQKQNENSTSQDTKENFWSRGAGFVSNRFPPILCSGTDADSLFYSLVLMGDLILASGCTMLLIMLWTVHKLYRKKRAQVRCIIHCHAGDSCYFFNIYFRKISI